MVKFSLCGYYLQSKIELLSNMSDNSELFFHFEIDLIRLMSLLSQLRNILRKYKWPRILQSRKERAYILLIWL
jgi:hypothetical protein